MFDQEFEPYQLEALAALFAAIHVLNNGITTHGAIPLPISKKFQEEANKMVNRLKLLEEVGPENWERLITMRDTILSNEHGKRLLLSTQ